MGVRNSKKIFVCEEGEDNKRYLRDKHQLNIADQFAVCYIYSNFKQTFLSDRLPRTGLSFEAKSRSAHFANVSSAENFDFGGESPFRSLEKCVGDGVPAPWCAAG